ncbi:nucleotidyltransferase domain-containing protein [Marinilabilia salmonicolor]|jgi:predicted nucleotidyltransferase|uniref:Nucleotidyltransferase-like protein n=1 Tax=Marinilabilia salmonicolor TaxID=989 RepID=A0A2T0XNX8_9BACT|nr:nucleotidyltransferase domain-containing protein [Marinilabilia salmonicolor]PRZ00658.1 nucleotidyltransferase-like protein [Marinilabilia salmonicolor]RCW30829.1 nucleotidyltransferase-like protein [Marinilabilia salmonicolor]
MINNQQILTQLKKHLQKSYGDSIRDVVLFGSRVKGNSNEYSDYDILIILNTDYTGKDENKILDLCYDIDLKYNILLDVHLLSIKELNSGRGKQPIYTKALNTGLYA